VTLDLNHHPCFNHAARKTHARIHLPVAPLCNIQCKYCKRGFDCVHESRPGVSSVILSPGQALQYLDEAIGRDPRISVVGIAGPGDPFANAEATMETLHGVRRRHPEILLCVASNGLGLPPFADELARLGVSHVTVTVNAVDATVAQRIYAWVRDGYRLYRGRAAAELLLERQQESVAALAARGVTVKINSIIIPGVNEAHVPEVARRMAELGAEIVNCVPLYPVAETDFAGVPQPSAEMVAEVRAAAGRFLPIMAHCTRCRADAAGLLGEPAGAAAADALRRWASGPLRPDEARPYVAVATLEGALVNQHLGDAAQLAIFAREEDGFRFVESRPAPPPGGGGERWRALAKVLHDCRAVLTAGAGGPPLAVLRSEGIRVVLMEGLIEEGLDAVFRGAEIRAPLRVESRCGSGCSGNGQGCS
jgi:nitrogen fixation protein NifB